jgi:hypothetical protein
VFKLKKFVLHSLYDTPKFNKISHQITKNSRHTASLKNSQNCGKNPHMLSVTQSTSERHFPTYVKKVAANNRFSKNATVSGVSPVKQVFVSINKEKAAD